jgi:energy-coupling factor transport system ATP-binding protein
MALFEIKNVSFYYPDEQTNTLNNITLSIPEGSFTVLCGASGSGKTTLLRHLKKELQPVGARNGHILYEGVPLEQQPDERTAEEIGMVFQHPDQQIVMDTVWHEMAFALENRGYPTEVIRKRTAEMAQFFGLEPLLHQSVHHLSGGQKQLVNLASILVLQPRVILLDEPTSQLDPVAAKEFLQMLKRLNDEFSMTIVLSEHRLEDVFPLADQIIFMDEGRVRYQGEPKAVCKAIAHQQDDTHFRYLPSIAKLYLTLEKGGASETPLTVRDGKRWFQSVPFKAEMEKKEKANVFTERMLQCKDVSFQYERERPMVLKKLSLSVYRGEFLAILGGNGAGKSTLLQVLAGLIQPQRGHVRLEGKKIHHIKETERFRRIGYLAQNPLLYFSHDTIIEELEFAAKRSAAHQEMNNLIHLLDLSSVLHKHPYDVSGGQQQKAALAIVLLSRPDILLLDEPTKGLDVVSKEKLAHILGTLRQGGLTIVSVTHDVEFAAKQATRCALLFDGDITSEGEPGAFFCHHYFYTTTVHRIVRDRLPNVFSYEEVARICSDRAASFSLQ